MAEKSLLDDNDGSSLLDAMPSKGSDACVYLMRHGATVMDQGANRSDGQLDMPLTDEGYLELVPAQQMLKAVPLAKIYSPDLKRTMQTAEVIQSGTVSSPAVVSAPNARTWNLGVLTGMKKEEARPMVEALKSNPTRRPPGGESYNEFKARFLAWLYPLMSKAEDAKKPVLMVLSGSSLRLVGQEFFGDESACDLDEAGLAALHYDGSWNCEVLLGHEDASEYQS